LREVEKYPSIEEFEQETLALLANMQTNFAEMMDKGTAPVMSEELTALVITDRSTR